MVIAFLFTEVEEKSEKCRPGQRGDDEVRIKPTLFWNSNSTPARGRKALRKQGNGGGTRPNLRPRSGRRLLWVPLNWMAATNGGEGRLITGGENKRRWSRSQADQPRDGTSPGRIVFELSSSAFCNRPRNRSTCRKCGTLPARNGTQFGAFHAIGSTGAKS